MRGDDFTLPDEALRGPLGDWVLAAAPHTEADPAALLVTALVSCGVAAGHRPHVWAGDARQAASLFAVVVAETPKANRGLSWAVTRRLMGVVDPDFVDHQVRTGLGNGLPLLETLNAAALADRRSGVPARSTGEAERVFVHDPAFTRALGLASRASSELPLLIRNAWDGLPLELGHGRHRVERHHIGVVAHATVDQLAQRLSLTDASASFVNRFLFVLVRRQRSLVDEGHVPSDLVLRYGRRLRDNLERASHFGVVERSNRADERWREAYRSLADDDPGGLLGIMVARAARHTVRVALIHALSEGSPRIELPHIEAALGLWSYSRRSAEVVTSSTPSASGDLAEHLLAAIASAGERGLTLSEQLDHFGRNIPAARLRVARRSLEEAGRIVSSSERRPRGGRPVTISRVRK